VRKELIQNTYGLVYDVKTGKVKTISAPTDTADIQADGQIATQQMKRAAASDDSDDSTPIKRHKKSD
jgi:hypothetical protein